MKEFNEATIKALSLRKINEYKKGSYEKRQRWINKTITNAAKRGHFNCELVNKDIGIWEEKEWNKIIDWLRSLNFKVSIEKIECIPFKRRVLVKW